MWLSFNVLLSLIYVTQYPLCYLTCILRGMCWLIYIFLNILLYLISYCFNFLQDCLNQEIACQYQNLMYHQINDDPALLGASSSHGSFLPISQPSAGFGFSQGSYVPNLPNSGLNYSMTSNVGFGKLGLDAMYNLRHFQSRFFSFSFFSPFHILLFLSPKLSKLCSLSFEACPKACHSWSL